MPPDVLLVLASSGITLVASLMFFVSEDSEPVQQRGPLLIYALPPIRTKAPPPLPSPECSFELSAQGLQTSMTLRLHGDEWVVTLATVPVADMPALQVDQSGEGFGAVHDLRWHGRAGLPRATRRSWKQKPGLA